MATSRAPGRHRASSTPSAAPGSPPAKTTPGGQRAAARYADYQRRQAQQRRSQRRQVAGRVSRVPVRGARVLQQGGRGGQHALMAEFLVFCGIVAFRAIADYVPSDQGQPTEGTAKGTVSGLTLQEQQQAEQHGKPAGQLGPLPILGAGFVIFFILAFIAARGGRSAQFAAAAGLVINAALLLKSMPQLATVSQAYAAGTSSSSGTAPADNAASGPNNAGSAPTPTGA